MLQPAGVPSAPGQVVATRNTKSSVFVQWEAPKHLNNLIGYYIDGRVVGAKEWFPCNHKPFKHTRWEHEKVSLKDVFQRAAQHDRRK